MWGSIGDLSAAVLGEKGRLGFLRNSWTKTRKLPFRVTESPGNLLAANALNEVGPKGLVLSLGFQLPIIGANPAMI